MLKIYTAHFLTIGLTAAVLGCACAPSEAAARLEGQVQAGGGAVANSTVTLWAASTGEPRQIGQTSTSSDGRLTPLGTIRQLRCCRSWVTRLRPRWLSTR